MTRGEEEGYYGPYCRLLDGGMAPLRPPSRERRRPELKKVPWRCPFLHDAAALETARRVSILSPSLRRDRRRSRQSRGKRFFTVKPRVEEKLAEQGPEPERKFSEEAPPVEPLVEEDDLDTKKNDVEESDSEETVCTCLESGTRCFCRELRRELARRDPTSVALENSEDVSAATAYIRSCAEYAIVPEPVVGKVLTHGARLELSHMSLGDGVAKTLAPALEACGPTAIDLKDNGLKDVGSLATALARCERLEELDLSQNPMPSAGVLKLAAAIAGGTTSRLKVLALEACKLSPSGLIALARALQDNAPALATVVLARNEIEETAADAWSKLFRRSESLREVDLAWTGLRRKAASLVCAGLSKSTVQTADLSWNAWYSTRDDHTAQRGLARLLSAPTTALTHLDLSFCRIGPADVAVLGAALERNTVLLGLHMRGNAGVCDARGFLRPRLDDRNTDVSLCGSEDPLSGADGLARLLLCQEPRGCARLIRTPCKVGTGVGTTRGTDDTLCCWICDRWSEHRFTFRPGISDEKDDWTREELATLAVSVRTSADGWEPRRMHKTEDGTFEIWRMLPPGRVLYSFLLAPGAGGVESTTQRQRRRRPSAGQKIEPYDCVALDRPTTPLPEEAPESLRQRLADFFLEKQSRSTTTKTTNDRGDGDGGGGLGDAKTTPKLRFPVACNVVEIKRRTHFTPPMSTRPRDAEQSEKVEWTVASSAFGQYRDDDEATISAAFEADYARTNLAKVLEKNSDDDDDQDSGEGTHPAKESLRKVFGLVQRAFKQAALSGGDAHAIGWNAFTDFTTAANLPCPKNLPRPDVDMHFFSSCRLGKPGPNNSKKSLCRFQFVDALARMALRRWRQSGEVDTAVAAIANLKDALERVPGVETDAQVLAFRDRMWCRETDDVVKQYADLLDGVYERYAVRDDKPGSSKSVGMVEWMHLFGRSGLNEALGLSERDAKQAFGRAIQTVTDEMITDKHRRMVYVEFLEALLRLADAIRLTSPDDLQPADALRVLFDDYLPRTLRNTTLTSFDLGSCGSSGGGAPGAARSSIGG